MNTTAEVYGTLVQFWDSNAETEAREYLRAYIARVYPLTETKADQLIELTLQGYYPEDASGLLALLDIVFAE